MTTITTPEVLAITNIFSSLISFALLCVAIYGLKQVSEIKLTRTNQAKRDSRQYSDDIVSYYLTEIEPLWSELNRISKNSKITIYDPSNFVSPEKISNNDISKKEVDEMRNEIFSTGSHLVASEYYMILGKLLNKLEKISFMINTNLGEEDLVYDCIGGTVLNLINRYNRNLRLSRKASLNKKKYIPFKNIDALYTRWYKKIIKEVKSRDLDAISEDASRLVKEIESLSTTKSEPLGTT